MKMNLENPKQSGSDSVVRKVRSVREAYAARFGYDLRRMVEDLKAKESKHPERLANLRALAPGFDLAAAPEQ